MSKSGNAFVARTQGTQFTLYAVMKALGIPLSKGQEDFQGHLERHYPPVVGNEVSEEIKLCERCRKKHGVAGYTRDCRNCEGWESCLHRIWQGDEPAETVERAKNCRYFALMGSHYYLTCRKAIY